MTYNSGMSKFAKKLMCILIISLTAGVAFAEPPAPPPGGGPGQMPPPPPPPPKDSENTMKYRGSRTYAENLPLKIKQVKCEKAESDSVILEIYFNQSINPRTVKNQNIYLNDEQLSSDIKIVFNKKGDTIKLQIPMNKDAFTIKLTKVRSYDGTLITAADSQVEVQISEEN